MTTSSLRPDDVQAKRYADIVTFREHAVPYLARDEARHNLPLGILSTVAHSPTTYSDSPPYLVTLEGSSGIQGLALMTPPHNLVIAQLESTDALAALVDALLTDRVHPPGVIAPVPLAGQFAQAWEARSGITMQRVLRQGIYSIRRLNAIPVVEGAARAAGASDRAQLIRWITAFGEEIGQPANSDRVRRNVDQKLASPDSGYFIWEVEGKPIALAGYGGPTPSGIRIGPVYTPPSNRRHGYGTAITAEVSRRMLAASRTFCFLYTDLANPISNSIYRKIGYEQVCESEEWRVDSSRVQYGLHTG